MMKGVALALVLCASVAGCAGVQEAAGTSQAQYDVVSRACFDAVADVGYVLSSNDLASGLIVARPALKGDESYSKMNIVLIRTAAGVSVSVKYIPTSGAKGDRGVVDAFMKALKSRLPDIAVSKAR